MAYQALVTEIHAVREHPNADKLNLATVVGYQVIVGKDIKQGEKVVFFEAGGQLSHEFVSENNLYRDTTLNKDPNASPGMLEKNRRVRAIRLRGEMSDGYVVPLRYFTKIGISEESLTPGLLFTEIEGKEICKKYETQKQKTFQANNQPKKKKEIKMFPQHFDTSPFHRESYQIKNKGNVYLTEKLHGTSHRLGHVQVEVPLWTTLKGFKKLVTKLFMKDQMTNVWEVVNGSRRVILDSTDAHKIRNSFYGTDEFRYKAVEGIIPKKGEILYGEIVGYVNADTPIMADQETKVIKKEKDLIEGLPEKIRFDYGCLPGQAKFYVYRITNVNEDGHETDLSWPQVKQRCSELGIDHVPEVGYSFADYSDSFTFEQFQKAVEFETETQRFSKLGNHIREGVVVRFEPLDGYTTPIVLKSKSRLFGLLEGYLRESDDFVDMEEVN